MTDLHVTVQGVLVFRLVDPVELGESLTGRYEIINKGRFAQNVGYLENGRTVPVLVGGRRGTMKTLPSDGMIRIQLATNY